MIHPAHSLLTTFIALSAIFFPTTAVAFVDDNTPLTYTVDFAEARNHYVTVTMNVVATETNRVDDGRLDARFVLGARVRSALGQPQDNRQTE